MKLWYLAWYMDRAGVSSLVASGEHPTTGFQTVGSSGQLNLSLGHWQKRGLRRGMV